MMSQLVITLTIAAMTTSKHVNTQQPEFYKVKIIEHQLDDVMELIDTTALKLKIREVEDEFRLNPTEINKVRLGIICHETALNLSFFSKTEYTGYAKKSFDILTELLHSSDTTEGLKPFVTAYRASALSLVGAETKKLKLLGKAFKLFSDAVKKYSTVSYLPEFLRGSVAENLPWYFFTKRKYAKKDFQSLINKQNANTAYANWKIMSFTYWAWAKQHQSKKNRTQALQYLDKAITLDPDYKAGRKKAEELKSKLLK
jgi:tetratricopeptide (TPR) repeat protein